MAFFALMLDFLTPTGCDPMTSGFVFIPKAYPFVLPLILVGIFMLGATVGIFLAKDR